MKPFNYFKLCFLILILSSSITYAQLIDTSNDKKEEGKTFFSIGFGFGYINPIDLYNYIKDYYINEGFSADNSDADINFLLNLT